MSDATNIRIGPIREGTKHDTRRLTWEDETGAERTCDLVLEYDASWRGEESGWRSYTNIARAVGDQPPDDVIAWLADEEGIGG